MAENITVGITLRADGSGLVGEVKLSREELERLQESARGVGPAATTGAAGVDKLGQEAREAAREVQRLGTEGRAVGAVGPAATAGAAGVDRLGREARETAREVQRLERESRGAGTAMTAMGRAGAAALAYFSVREIINFGGAILDTAGRMQTLETRISAFVGTGPALAETMDFIARTADRQSQEIFTVAESYSKLLPLVDSGIISMRDARDILVGFNDVAARTGATSAQLGQTMFGLSQGLSAGVLRAEELNQVTEPLPGLLQALDRASGQAAGGFRRMVVEGKVTSEFFRTTLIDALKEYEGAAEETAGNIEATAVRFSTAWSRAAASIGSSFAGLYADVLDLGTKLGNYVAETYAKADTTQLEQRLASLVADVEREQVRLTAALAAAGDGEIPAGIAAAIEKSEARIRDLRAEILSVNLELGRFGGGRVPGGIQTTEAGGSAGVSTPPATPATETRKEETALIEAQASALSELLARMEEETRLLGMNAEARAEAEAVLRAQAAAMEDGNLLTVEQIEQVKALAREKFALVEAERQSAAAVEETTDALAEADQRAKDFKESMRDAGQAIGTAFEDAIVNGENFRDVLAGLEQDIIRIATRLAVTKPLENAIGGVLDGIDFGSVFGSLFGGGASATGGTPMAGQRPWIFHGGGVVGQAHGTRRDLPPQLFSQAPRMHGGGMLGHDEVPIVGKRGEVIGWPEQLAAAFGANVIVQNIDQRSGGEIRREESRGPNGERLIKNFILDAVDQGIAGGRFDRSMGQAFGATRVGRR